MTTSYASKSWLIGIALGLAVALPGTVGALETPPESPVIECGDHMQAMLSARQALVTGDRISAIRNLRRAQDALRACSLRSEAEEIAFG